MSRESIGFSYLVKTCEGMYISSQATNNKINALILMLYKG